MNEPTTPSKTGSGRDLRKYEATGVPNIARRVGTKDLYFFKKVAGGRRLRRDLNTTNLDEAKKRAKAVVELIAAGKWDEITGIKERSGWSTMPELYQAYLDTATIKTKKQVTYAMRLLLKVAGKDPDGSSTQLNAKTVWDYQQAMKKRAGDPPDNLKLAHLLRSASSILGAARQMFAEKVLPAYGKLSIPAHVLDRTRDPNARGFMTAPDVAAPTVQYVEPPATVIKRISAEYPELRNSDPGAYIAFLLGAFVGLRNNEVVAARWDWVVGDVEDEAKTWLEIRISSEYTTKTQRPRDVDIPGFVLAELIALRGALTFDKVPGDRVYLVPAPHKTDRSDRVFRRLNRWLRKRGLDHAMFKKGFYELRKYFGNDRAWRGGTYQTARAMGNSPEVVEKYYSSTQGKAPTKIAVPQVSAIEVQNALREIRRASAA